MGGDIAVIGRAILAVERQRRQRRQRRQLDAVARGAAQAEPQGVVAQDLELEDGPALLPLLDQVERAAVGVRGIEDALEQARGVALAREGGTNLDKPPEQLLIKLGAASTVGSAAMTVSRQTSRGHLPYPH